MHDRAASLDAGTRHWTAARDGERMAIRSHGGDWSIAWFPPTMVPEGMPHGANALCVAGDGGVVLISNDGERWGWPGGRPEGDESWEQTLRREILEETCAVVRDARLLGFCWAACVAGPERTACWYVRSGEQTLNCCDGSHDSRLPIVESYRPLKCCRISGWKKDSHRSTCGRSSRPD
jgi:hypothetical protein